MEAGRHHRPRSFGIPRFQSGGTTKIVKFQSLDADLIVNNITAALMELDLCGHIIFSAYGDVKKILVDTLEAMNCTGITMISVPPVDCVGCRFLAKILVAEGSKEVAMGQPIAVTGTYGDEFLSNPSSHRISSPPPNRVR